MPLNLEGRFSGLKDPERERAANEQLKADRELEKHPELLQSAEEFKTSFLYDMDKRFFYPAEGEDAPARSAFATKAADFIQASPYWQTRRADVEQALFAESEHASTTGNIKRKEFIDQLAARLPKKENF